MSTTVDRFRKQAKQVSQGLYEMPGAARDVAQEKLQQVREKGSKYYEQGRDKAYEAELAVEHFIQKRPLKSVLIAAAVGIVFGRIWRRRRTAASVRSNELI
jgi:ElaB/YqjD/DUF883 family membrane-anchored ribosome-binding protein